MKLKKSIMVTIVSGMFLISALVFFVLKNRGEAQSAVSQKTLIVRSVPTAVVQSPPKDCVRLFPGKVRANRRVELAFSVPGLLDQLNAEEGCSIRKGEIVARLDQRDYRYALDRAKAKLENAKRELARYASLWEQKAAARVEYENAETSYHVALAEFRICQKALEDTMLHAPFDGVIAKRYVENQEHVQAKKAIVSFQDISRIEVIIQIPERLIAHGGIAALKILQVRFDADSEHWFDATVREHSAKSDSITQTYDVVLVLAPPADLKVFPGMTATVRARITEPSALSASLQDVARIPAEALCRGDAGRSYVWVIDPAGGNPKKILVESAELCGDYVDVRSELHPGELVAIAGLHMLQENSLVRPMLNGKEGLDG